MAAGPTLINSVVRALRLLDLVAEEGRPVSAKKLARLSETALATTYHLLRTLVHEGYLAKTEGGYVVGVRPAIVAARQHDSMVDQRIHRQLRILHDELRAASYMAVLRDGEIALVDIVDSPAAPRTDLWVDLTDSAHATALGKAVLAAMPEVDRLDYLARHPLIDLTRNTRTCRRTLLAELGHDDPVVFDQEEYNVGTTCLAVRVPAPHITAAVAISVPPSAVGRVMTNLPALRRAATLLGLSCADDGGWSPPV